MRQSLVTLLGFLVLSVPACSGDADEPEMPTTILIAVEPEFAELALEIAAELLEPVGLKVEPAPAGVEPHLRVGFALDDGSVPFLVEPLVAVTRLDSEIQGLNTNVDGVPAEAPLDRIHEWLNENRMGLVPLSAVDVAMRVVPVDGVDPVFGQGDVSSYPLGERAWVSAAVPEDDPDLALILEQTKEALAERLALEFLPPKPIILRATGDIIPARCVYAKQLQYGDFAHAFRELGSWLSQADVTVGSLDASISDAGRPFGCEETFSLLAPAQSVEGLELAGFDVITVATNHVKDCGMDACGDEAFFDTLNNLRAAGIEPAGGGADLAEARAPVVIDVRGTTFAFLGGDQIASYYHASDVAAGVAPLREDYLREDVAAAKAIADVVVVLPQWGVEYTHNPTESQRPLAAAAVDVGADLVVGNHPHWVQAVETIDDAFVAYALGNFVFDQDWSVKTQQGVVLEAAFFGAELKGVRLVPIRIVDMHQPTFAEPKEAQQILDGIWGASAALR